MEKELRSLANKVHTTEMASHEIVRRLRQERWQADIAVLITLVLYVWLPAKLVFGPVWLMPACAIVLLVPLTVSVPQRHTDRLHWQRLMATALIAVINAANIISLVLLVSSLLKSGKNTGGELIIESIKIWLTNVLVFALWYWELDRGGPGERLEPTQRYPDFLFPQMSSPQYAPEQWAPGFVDYLYLSFTNATAFSPTDTMPLTKWPKMLMLVQSLTSLLTVALVAARAVNILN